MNDLSDQAVHFGPYRIHPRQRLVLEAGRPLRLGRRAVEILLILLEQQRVDAFVALVIIGREIAISALREWMAQIGASRSVAVHMVGKLKTTVQMVAIPFLLYDGQLFGLIPTRLWGTWLIYAAVVLTIWSMVYYLQKAVPEIRAKAR